MMYCGGLWFFVGSGGFGSGVEMGRGCRVRWRGRRMVVELEFDLGGYRVLVCL